MIPPIVELSSLRAGASAAVSLRTADTLVEQLQRRGFVYIKSPLLPAPVVQNVKSMGRQFFTTYVPSLSAAACEQLRASGDSSGFRGLYQYVGTSGVADKITCFSIGNNTPRPWELREDYLRKAGYGGSLEAMPRSIFATNRWPQEGLCTESTGSDHSGFREAEFQRVMLDYYSRCHDTCMDVLRHISLSLGIVEVSGPDRPPTDISDRGDDSLNFFSPFHDKRDHDLQIKFYPDPPHAEQDAAGEAARMRLDSHQDLSTITLLAQDNLGGLEVFDAESEQFVAAPIVPDAVLLNAGSFLEKWTDGAISATPHRVVAAPARQQRQQQQQNDGGRDVANTHTAATEQVHPEGRLSVVFFCWPNHDALITPLVENGKDRAFLAGDIMPLLQ